MGNIAGRVTNAANNQPVAGVSVMLAPGQGITVRCLMGPDGALPASEDDDDIVAVVARAY